MTDPRNPQPVDRLVITQADIDQARTLYEENQHSPRTCRPCVLECTAARHFGIPPGPRVTCGYFALQVDHRIWNMSPEAHRIAMRWDDTKTAEPGQAIDLYDPPEWLAETAAHYPNPQPPSTR